MKISCLVESKVDISIAQKATDQAVRQGLRDTIVAVHGDAVRNSPVSATYPSISKTERRPTGNNKRSINAAVAGLGHVGGNGRQESLLDETKQEAVVYCTSGYGGYLEVGTSRMAARPYARPAADLHGKELPTNIRKHMK